MSELMILKEKLIKDPLFRSLFNKANDMQEAIKVASLYGIRLSIEDVTAHRKELRTVIGRQSFHLDFARPSDASWSWWGGGEEGARLEEADALTTVVIAPAFSSSQMRSLPVNTRVCQCPA